MKPRVFLGSSVEGLSVAYAIQNNLSHDADITVWSQGVFELSKTTIESLFDSLENVDFGIFVFTPDDLIKIRDKSTATVRDNVLFEFGLFLGKLGRQRVFFVIPSEHELHLPTDLLGITPATYESNRQDDNFLAATGAASHQVRLMIKKYGSIQQIEEASNTPEIIDNNVKENNSSWIDDYFAKRYKNAIEKLDIEIEKETDIVTIIRLKSTKGVCYYRIDEKNLKFLENILSEHENELEAYLSIGRRMLWENFIDRAIEIVEEGKSKFGNSIELIDLITQCHLKNGDKDLAINCFRDDLTLTDPDMAINFSNIYIEDLDYTTARIILHKAYLNYPNNKALCAKYASVATELGLYNVALFFYDKLANEEPMNSSHKGYIGNSCLKLNLNDMALNSYQEADKLANNSQGWILSNIGNILKNKGFYTEGIKFFRKDIEINPSSEYALERLASSLKLKEDEHKEYKNLVIEGRKMVKEFSINLISTNKGSLQIES